MTVKELIERLEKVDPTLEVAVCVSTLAEGVVHGRVDDESDIDHYAFTLREVNGKKCAEGKTCYFWIRMVEGFKIKTVHHYIRLKK